MREHGPMFLPSFDGIYQNFGEIVILGNRYEHPDLIPCKKTEVSSTLQKPLRSNAGGRVPDTKKKAARSS